MIKKMSTALSVLSFVVPVPVLAEGEAFEYRGSIELGLMGADVDGRNSAKFEEYRDMDDGLFGTLQFDALKDSSFLQMDAANPGRDDQSVDVHGGRYGSFKYNLYFDEMPHNYSYNALSFYRGLGTNHLMVPADPTATPPNSFETSTATWSTFDYSVQHKKYGGQVEVALAEPYFVNFGVERREQDGKRPFSVRENIEVPLPISYVTDNLNMQAGYLGKNITASVTGYLSSFTNDNKYLLWDDPSPDGNNPANIVQSAVTDPDNDMGKLAADFSWRGLPLKSALAMNASYTNLSNSISANEINVNPYTMGTDFYRLNRTQFDGDIDYTSFSAALVSEPLPRLDTRIYYRFLERENHSTHIFYNTGSGNNARELLSYDKNTAGAELGYRLPYRTKFSLGYDYENIDRSTPLPAYVDLPDTYYRYDNPASTTNDTFFAKLKNSWLGWLTTTVKYKHLERNSDYTGVYDPYLNQGVIRFDAANKSMDEIKLGLEFSPFDRLDFGVDFTYQKNDYDYSRESRTSDERKNVYLDMTWRPFKKASLNTYVGFEYTETDANRITNLETNATPLYGQFVDDNFWTYGITLDLPEVIDKLSFRISWQYQKSDGSVKYNNSYTNTDLVNISDSDDYTKKTLEAKAIYAFDAHWSMTVGYLYEKFNFSDIAYENYKYILNNSDYYSGVYYDQNYNANVGYVILAYRF
ncbi:MtrB/PioB family outer membrane beta-barrel protein [Desulfobulbus sp.]|uniref:MtrB/PioB family outer membrane beta-barrel protein n=1 Tax=Desulfobulbus sp. TaxID=895 RepID=UPI00286F0B26|nr:MtrB/PioB family outer membrane beta-barrel protein [Desulfobulbus sp.]